MRKTLANFWAQMDPFCVHLPPETDRINCTTTGLTLFSTPYISVALTSTQNSAEFIVRD